MTDQEKLQSQFSDRKTPEEDQAKLQPEQHDRFKETTEKIWGSTKHVWSTATFKANQYKKLVQKKIDQAALHKKIHAAHADLGKLIDDLREAGAENILNLSEVREILTRIDELKAEAVAIEEEVEQIRSEELSQEHAGEEPREEEKTL
ncbi:MAG: hypothetical protein ACSLFH_05420 [Desulfuromonadales bacterium]